ncbi:MAG: heavy-metal-associated domain-containing protein [Candidatus Mariimomonas ferrooxydans]
MINRTLLIYITVLLFSVIINISLASAKILSAKVSVDGLACPFCAYGVEKKLKRVKGVGSMDIRMQEGTVTLTAEQGQSIDFAEVPGAIKNSGFSMRQMKLVASGTVMEEDGNLFLRYEGPGERLALKDVGPALRDKLTISKTVIVKGYVTGKPGGPWSLKPESVEDVAK